MRFGPSRPPLYEPALALEVAEYDAYCSVGGDQLQVAAAKRASRPPAVLDQPLLAHRLDRRAPDRLGVAGGVDADICRSRAIDARRHSGKGVSTIRRSGMRDPGSTSSTRSSDSGP